jgi:hypothetical protein
VSRPSLEESDGWGTLIGGRLRVGPRPIPCHYTGECPLR